MTQYLPPNLLALFAPREPIPYLEPLDQLPWEKKPWLYNGVSKYLSLFEDPSETPAPTRAETREERITRKQQEREDRHRDKLERTMADWEPGNDQNADGDPFKTLFVGRINFDTSESKLRREFEVYGTIRRIHMVMDQEGKPRGYAFIEYERERDMNAAYKHADGKKIDGKRVVVDVERGRTVKTWKPRRLGGGLGGTRIGAPHENIKYSGRVDERDMAREKDRERDRERDREGERPRERRERSRSKDRDRRHRSRSRERKRRSRSRERDRERRDRSRSRERKERMNSNRRDRDKDRERDKDRNRDKERGRDKERDRDRERDKERGRDRERDRDRKRDREGEDRKDVDDYRDKRIKIEGEHSNGNSDQMEA